jgi:predicted XRE-type DNA-binding protein
MTVTVQDTGETFPTIWHALFDDPAEIASLQMRSEALGAIALKVKTWELTQAEAAKRLGISQPRLNDLLRGRISRFSLDALIKIATSAGMGVNLEFRDVA